MEEIGERLRKAFLEMKKPKPQTEKPIEKTVEKQEEKLTLAEIDEHISRLLAEDRQSDNPVVVAKKGILSSSDLYKKLKDKRGLNYF